jgi:hypothetical protein
MATYTPGSRRTPAKQAAKPAAKPAAKRGRAAAAAPAPSGPRIEVVVRGLIVAGVLLGTRAGVLWGTRAAIRAIRSEGAEGELTTLATIIAISVGGGAAGIGAKLRLEDRDTGGAGLDRVSRVAGVCCLNGCAQAGDCVGDVLVDGIGIGNHMAKHRNAVSV